MFKVIKEYIKSLTFLEFNPCHDKAGKFSTCRSKNPVKYQAGQQTPKMNRKKRGIAKRIEQLASGIVNGINTGDSHPWDIVTKNRAFEVKAIISPKTEKIQVSKREITRKVRWIRENKGYKSGGLLAYVLKTKTWYHFTNGYQSPRLNSRFAQKAKVGSTQDLKKYFAKKGV